MTRFNELLADGQLELLDHDETQVGGPCPRCAHPGPHRMTYENQIVVIPDLPDADRRLLLDRLDDRVPEAGREQFAVEEIAFFRCRCAHDHGIEDPDPADPKGCGLLLAVEVEEA